MAGEAIGRRGLLAAIGAAGLAASAPAAATPQKLPLTAQTTEGPYYLDLANFRTDLTDGREGVPLDVRLRVLDAAGRPLRGLRTDLWHCDAQGNYSGFGGQGDDRTRGFEGQAFLRGSQRTDRDGQATFATLYPGWYAGRTTHIHVKVHHRERAVLTTQFFLPDALSEFLYTQVSSYQRARLRDTLNSADGIALRAGDTVLGAVREEGRRYVALLTLVVDPAARPVTERPPSPGRGPMSAGGVRPMRPRTPEGLARIRALVPPRTEG